MTDKGEGFAQSERISWKFDTDFVFAHAFASEGVAPTSGCWRGRPRMRAIAPPY
jgi:hypothetical protein